MLKMPISTYIQYVGRSLCDKIMGNMTNKSLMMAITAESLIHINTIFLRTSFTSSQVDEEYTYTYNLSSKKRNTFH